MNYEIYKTNYLDFYDPVKCMGDLGEKWCNFKWRVYNLQLNPQEICQSPVFTTRLLPKTYWYLQVKISSPGDLEAMKISLCRHQSNENIISVVDVIYKVICHEEINASEKRTFLYNNNKLSSDSYSYTSSFHKSKSDYITFECKLRPNKVMSENVCHDSFDKTLPVDLRKLLQSGELCDTIIQVGNRQFLAHYVILSVRLPKLVKLPNYFEKEKHLFKINDLPVFVVKEMLKYAYTGQAYLDLDSASIYKDNIEKLNTTFYQRCFWEDDPFATTFFNYETDSLTWNLKELCINSNFGRERIELLRLYPNELELSLDVLESEEDKKGLTLRFKFCCEEMPKSTIVSCVCYLVNEDSKEKLELGEFETLLSSNKTKGRFRLCSLLEVSKGRSNLCAREEYLVLRTDFKFCYGSSKSSIENLYEGNFNISQCTSCASLCSDMERVCDDYCQTDIWVENGEGFKVRAHKAILFARMGEEEKLKVKENKIILIEGYDEQGLCEFLRKLYLGR